MSEPMTRPIHSPRQESRTIAIAGVIGAQMVAAAGVAAAASAVAAADGALTVKELVRDAIRDTTAARGSAATFLVYPTGLSAEALPLFRTGLEAQNIRFAEGGSLVLADDRQPQVAYSAIDPDGRVLFFVREAEDGWIELLVRDRRVLPQVEAVIVQTLIALAKATLSQQGFNLARQGSNSWKMERETEDGIIEQVEFRYRHGELQTDAVSLDQGRLLTGEACPKMSAFERHFRHFRPRPLSSLRIGSDLSADRQDTAAEVEQVREVSRDRRHKTGR